MSGKGAYQAVRYDGRNVEEERKEMHVRRGSREKIPDRRLKVEDGEWEGVCWG